MTWSYSCECGEGESTDATGALSAFLPFCLSFGAMMPQAVHFGVGVTERP